MEGNWLQELFTKGLEEIGNGIDKLYLLADNIDSIQFNQESYIYQFVGLIRYILGDPLFIAVGIFFDIALGFVMYKVLKKIVEIISQLFVKLKGKLIIP